MGNLSALTIGGTTFPVFAVGGASDMPIHVILPKSASDSTPSGLAMLAWSNGMRYVYCTADPGSNDVTGFIPPEYMGNGSVYVVDKFQTIHSTFRASSAPYALFNVKLGQYGNSVIGDSTSGANVIFEAGFSGTTSATNKPITTKSQPAKTSILFFVNPE